MTITVEIKNVYGTEMVYPVCDTAKKFARLTGRKTLTMSDIFHIKSLGYTLETQGLTL